MGIFCGDPKFQERGELPTCQAVEKQASGRQIRPHNLLKNNEKLILPVVLCADSVVYL
jgi:hypothetical protein